MGKRVKPLDTGAMRPRASKDLFSYAYENDLLGQSFAEISPHLKLSISSRAKRVALRLDPKHRVIHLVVPKRSSLRTAYLFAESNKDWIREKLRELPRPVLFQDGEILPILGRDRKIIVLYNESLKRTDVMLKKDELLVLTNKPDPSVRIRRFLSDLARQKLTELAFEKAAEIRRTLDEVTVKDTRSRWGSCTDDRRISFSWRLIFAPQNAFDYVVAHEVAHLAYMDHSHNFWRVCEKLSKQYEDGKGWMSDHGHSLMRFGS